MRTCICDSCGMEFEIEALDRVQDTLKDGQEVEVLSFTCPKCDERYIVAVRDTTSASLQKSVQAAKEAYRNSYGADEYKLKKEMEFHKRQLSLYMSRLKKRYLKELRKRG